MQKLSEKDKRTLRVGGILVGAILVSAILMQWVEHWGQVRESLAVSRGELKMISSAAGSADGGGLILPAFEMPQRQEQQQFLFRDKLAEQFKTAKIKTEPLQVIPATKTRQGGYRVMRLKTGGSCKLGQIFDFIANIEENPYLVSVEEFRIKCDEKNRENIEFDLTVSTFVR